MSNLAAYDDTQKEEIDSIYSPVVNRDLNSVRSKRIVKQQWDNDVKYINNSIELKGGESLTETVT